MKIFIDFDDTIVNSTETFVRVYNKRYGTKVRCDDIVNHGFKPQLDVRASEVVNIFSSNDFRKELKPFHGVYKALKELKSNGFELYLITNCSDTSTVQKLKWFEGHQKYSNLFDGKIFLSLCKPYDKSVVDMKGAVLIDDHKENHKLSNAEAHLAYNTNTNRTWCPTEEDGVKVFDSWAKIKDYLVKNCLPRQ